MKINGMKIIAHLDLPCYEGRRDGRLILVDQYGCGDRYVVAHQYRGCDARDKGPWDKEWIDGQYRELLLEAWVKFSAMAGYELGRVS